MHSLFCGAVDSIGVVTFTVDGQPPAVVAAALSAEHGIGVRDGAFCAHPLVRRLLGAAGCTDGATAPVAGQALRASVGLGSTTEHVGGSWTRSARSPCTVPASAMCSWTDGRCRGPTTGRAPRSHPGDALALG